jgi:predicted Zn-dependent protease
MAGRAIVVRTLQGVRGLLWACVALFAVAGSPKVTAARTRANASLRPPLIVVREVGNVPSGTLLAVCRGLLAAYPVRCEIRTGRTLSETRAWNPRRGQLDARQALESMFRDRAGDAVAEINVTQVDIFESGKPYVFGLASLTDRVALVSLHRIDDGSPSFSSRLTKLVLHEAGHALGLHHHDVQRCVMRQDSTPASLDTAPKGPCEQCHTMLSRQARRLTRPGQLALDRARSHLVRGEPTSAREHLAGTLSRGEFDEDVLAEFGRAFFEAEQYNESISILRYVVKHDPNLADAHANLGLAYQLRARKGDRRQAIRHFQRALELRPGWALVAAHLDGLQDPTPTAQGPAGR